MTRRITRFQPARPPTLDELPLVHAYPEVQQWVEHYWQTLNLPADQLRFLAVTNDRAEFALWTGRRLNTMALGCYCYLPLPPEGTMDDRDVLNHVAGAGGDRTTTVEPPGSSQLALPGFAPRTSSVAVVVLERPTTTEVGLDFRHLIFVEPELLPLGTEVTVAHELIHLADRVRGNPRKHRCHGHDSISVDEAAITGRDPELLRELLRDETARREEKLRALRPNRYLYLCPNCAREYRRVRKYTREVSCGSCDAHFNPFYLLRLHATLDKAGAIERLIASDEA